LTFEVPPVADASRQTWRRCIDTALQPPEDISPWATAPLVTQATYQVEARSVVLLALPLEQFPLAEQFSS
jgi:isoamylase